MKKLFIYIGSKSSAIADFALLKHPNYFSSDIRYQLAIGRAIKTNWGRKSLSILSEQIKERIDDESKVQDELKGVMQKYNAEGAKTLLAISHKDESKLGSKSNIKQTLEAVSQKISFNKFFLFIEQKKYYPGEIALFLKNSDLEDDPDFYAEWIKRSSEASGFTLDNLILFCQYKVENEINVTNLINLAKAYLIAQQFNLARDTFYKASIAEASSPWLSYVLGTSNKQVIHSAFQLGEFNAQIVHPLLDNQQANKFFDKHNIFLKHYYTDHWKESLKIDFQLRRLAKDAKKSPDNNLNLDPNILFITDKNWNFLTYLIDEISQLKINLDVYDYSYLSKKLDADKNIKSRYIHSPLHSVMNSNIGFDHIKKLDPVFFQKINEADIIFCEWGNELAILLSKFLPASKKLVVRIHSYEAFTHWHLGINLGGVDGLIFVAPHIKNIFFNNASPQYYDCLFKGQVAVIPNVKNFESYTLNKEKNANFTLGMAGFNKKNKGLLKSLKILNKLRSQDERWVLRLAGDKFIENSSEDYRYWIEECKPYIQKNSLEDHVVFDGFQDMSAWLKNIGYILSTSDREGTHEALLEGVASGCIPIIIDWSMVKKFGGVKKLYPFLVDFVLNDESEIDTLNTQNLHLNFNKLSSNLSKQMRDFSDAKRISQDIVTFLESVYHEA